VQRYLGVFVLALLSVVSAFGQKPDFSGTWKQIDHSGWVRIDKIEHKDPYLKVATDARSAPGSNARLNSGLMGTNEYSITGEENSDNDANGRQCWTTVGWQGSDLVFLKIVKDGYHVTVTRETWMLSDDGNTLTRTTRVINMDGVTNSTLTFERQ
jgi:hypothetical protein